MTALVDVADELYSLVPGDFTAARNARAKELKASGERDLAVEVARLPKPSVAAWAANLLIRTRPDRMRDVLALGEQLRKAQEGLDPAALRDLAQQRRRLVGALAKDAAEQAERAGQRLGPPAVEELEQTLQAALADADAGDAVLTGRLVRGLSSTGFEAVDLDGAVAGGEGIAASMQGTPRKGGAAPNTAKPVDELEQRRRERRQRELAEAREDVDDAEQDESEARAAADTLDRRATELTGHRDELRRRIRELEAQIEELEDEVAQTGRSLRDLAEKQDEAGSRAERPEGRAERAGEALRQAMDGEATASGDGQGEGSRR